MIELESRLLSLAACSQNNFSQEGRVHLIAAAFGPPNKSYELGFLSQLFDVAVGVAEACTGEVTWIFLQFHVCTEVRVL
jgi:hypothetical protein